MLDKFRGRRAEARVLYKDGDFEIRGAGDFVRCAVTGEPIELSNLKYWSVERQEAYSSAAASLERHLALLRNPGT